MELHYPLVGLLLMRRSPGGGGAAGRLPRATCRPAPRVSNSARTTVRSCLIVCVGRLCCVSLPPVGHPLAHTHTPVPDAVRTDKEPRRPAPPRPSRTGIPVAQYVSQLAPIAIGAPRAESHRGWVLSAAWSDGRRGSSRCCCSCSSRRRTHTACRAAARHERRPWPLCSPRPALEHIYD